MPYGLQDLHPAAQLAFLDACAILGVKVLYDMKQLGLTALGGMNYDKDWASSVWRADVVSNVTLVKSHSASKYHMPQSFAPPANISDTLLVVIYSSWLLYLRRLLPDRLESRQCLQAGQAIQSRQVDRAHEDCCRRHSVQQRLDVDGRAVRTDRT